VRLIPIRWTQNMPILLPKMDFHLAEQSIISIEINATHDLANEMNFSLAISLIPQYSLNLCQFLPFFFILSNSFCFPYFSLPSILLPLLLNHLVFGIIVQSILFTLILFLTDLTRHFKFLSGFKFMLK